MGGLLTSFNTGVSGLQSAQTSLYTTSHNLANSATQGYTRQQVLVTDHKYTNTMTASGDYVQIGLGTSISTIRQIRNTFLDAQYRLQFGRQGFYETQNSTLDEVMDLFGEMEGEEYRTALDDLWKGLQQLNNSPNDIVYRDQLVAMADSLIEKTVVIKNQLDSYQVSLNTEVSNQVNRINEITTELKKLNRDIQKYEITGDVAKDFRDSRNLLLDELSQYINYELIEEVDGTVSIYTESNYLLTSEQNYELAVAPISETSNLVNVIWKNTEDDFFLSKDMTYSSESKTDVGSLRALLISRGDHIANYYDIPVRPDIADYTADDGTVDRDAYQQALNQFGLATDNYNKTIQPSIIMKTQAQFEQLMHGLVTTINDVFCPNKEVELDDGTKILVLDEENAPIGDDADKTMGVELFTRRNMSRYEKVTVTLSTGETTEVYKYNEEDPDDPYSLYSIGQLEVNQLLKNNSSYLPLISNENSGNVDGYDMKVTQNLLNAWESSAVALDPNDLTTYMFSDYYTALIGEIGTQGNVWQSIIERQTDLTNSIDDNRQAVMGVSSDEELADLVKFQHCYNASSRYITVIDEMLEHIINRLGA